jgi:hypothetical protein
MAKKSSKKSLEEQEKLKLKSNTQNAQKLKINTPPKINSH